MPAQPQQHHRSERRPSPAPPAGRRRTQEERSATTREALLDATIECLVAHGYVGATTSRIAERAGVTRGAQIHHFERRADLFVAALLHLAARRRTELLERAARELPAQANRTSAAVDLLWATFSGPLFTAALELWIAARTDEELLAALLPAEREIGRSTRTAAEELFAAAGVTDAATRRQYALAIEMTANAMRGMALQQLLDPSTARRDRQLSFAKEMLRTYFVQTGAPAPAQAPAAEATAGRRTSR